MKFILEIDLDTANKAEPLSWQVKEALEHANNTLDTRLDVAGDGDGCAFLRRGKMIVGKWQVTDHPTGTESLLKQAQELLRTALSSPVRLTSAITELIQQLDAFLAAYGIDGESDIPASTTLAGIPRLE